MFYPLAEKMLIKMSETYLFQEDGICLNIKTKFYLKKKFRSRFIFICIRKKGKN